MAKYIIDKSVHRKIDTETGEIEEVESQKLLKITVSDQEEFFMVYISFIAPMLNLKYVRDIKVLVRLCCMAEWETGVVLLTPSRRKVIMDDFDINKSNMSTLLKRLVDHNAVSKTDEGELLINPTVFWKGSKESRQKLLRNEEISTIFKYNIDQKTGRIQE